MKTILVLALLAFSFRTVSAWGCGDGRVDRKDQKILKELSGKDLTCTDEEGNEFSAHINARAKFRCIGSPLIGIFIVGKSRTNVDTIKRENDDITVNLEGSSGTINCHE